MPANHSSLPTGDTLRFFNAQVPSRRTHSWRALRRLRRRWTATLMRKSCRCSSWSMTSRAKSHRCSNTLTRSCDRPVIGFTTQSAFHRWMSVLLDSSPTEDSCRVVIGGRVCLNFSSAVVIFGFCKHSLELDGKVAGLFFPGRVKQVYSLTAPTW